MSLDIEEQLVQRLRGKRFAIQLDESIDVAGSAQVPVYVRYPREGKTVEDFLFCQPLETQTAGEEIFKPTDSYMCEHSLKWSDCIGVCTLAGVTHCIVHREAAAARHLEPELHIVRSDTVKTVNLV